MSPATPNCRRGLFVTGTDTGVGKTVVSCGLLRFAADRGVPLLPYKPVETGCDPEGPHDALLLREASRRHDLPLSSVCPYQLRRPVAPAAAAAAQRVPLSLVTMRRHAQALLRQAPADAALLSEGAGGLLTPYTDRATAADLARALALPVLLIARNALGTINHTALAVAELRRRRLPILGIVLVATAPGGPTRAQRNPGLIESLTGLRPHELPHFPRPHPDAVAAHLARSGLGATLLAAAGFTGSRARRFPFSGR